MIIEALVVAFVAAFYVGFDKAKLNLAITFTYTAAFTVLSALAMYVILYATTPAFVGIMGGYYNVAILPCIVGSIVLVFLAAGRDEPIEVAVQALKLCVFIALFIFVAIAPLTNTQELHDLPKVTVHGNISNSDFAPIDPQNMRIVDQSMAYYMGNKVIGSSDQNLGSQFRVTQSDFTIQNVNGRLYWVAPLEFRDVWKWMSADTSPGFIMVDAEDPSKPAKLYIGYKMKYMTSSYFGDYVIRHLYTHGYTKVELRDINFEVTDSLKPMWVVTLTNPTIVNTGDVVNGVAVIDPETGKITKYALGNVPAWVDRVMPEGTAMNYLSWYGTLGHGWLNAAITEKDVNVITSNEMYFIHGKDGEAYWFTGMTSPSSADQSLTSIALVSSRDGSVDIYKTSGLNEHAAVNAVNAAPGVSNYKNYNGCQPIPYDCSGRLAYVVPVAASTSLGSVYQEVAIVDALTGHVSVGDTKAKAFEGFRRYINQNGYDFAVTETSVQATSNGEVGRISGIVSSGDLGYRLVYLNNSESVYEVSVSQFPEIAFTDVGDLVNMSYDETGDSIVNVGGFDNLELNVKISTEQMNYSADRVNQTAVEENNWDKQQELQNELDSLRNDAA